MDDTPQATVIPSQDSLIGDLLSLDLNPPASQQSVPVAHAPSNVDLLGGGLDALVSDEAEPRRAEPPPPRPVSGQRLWVGCVLRGDKVRPCRDRL